MAEDVTLENKIPVPRLLVKAGGQVTQELPLGAEITIGRAEDNDLTLIDPKVSRHHARVVREGMTFVLTDLGSSNGTLVNGVRLTAPHTLRHGERITIGDAELTYWELGSPAGDTLKGPVLVPPPPASSQQEGGERNWILAAVLVAAAVLIVVGGITLVLLAPELLQRVGLVSPPAPTPRAESGTPPAIAETPVTAAATPTVAVLTPVVAETPVDLQSPTTEVLTPATSPESSTEFEELMAQAAALTRRSKFEEAVAVYGELAGRAPQDASVEAGWAWALLLDKEGEEALVHARRAVELDPESAIAAIALARSLVATGDEEGALAAAQAAVALDSGNAEAHAALAEAYLASGRIQEAVDEGAVALVQDSQSANAHRVRGWLYQAADNNLGGAAGELQMAAGLEPELWLRRHELGLLLLEAEDYATALLAFQDALGLRPMAATYTAIGQAYYELGQLDLARASLQQALDAGAGDLDTYALLAATSALQDGCEEAELYYEQALELDPADALALEARDICEGKVVLPSPSPTKPLPPSPTPAGTSEPVSRATQPPASLGGRIAFPVWNRQSAKYDTYVANTDGSGRSLVVDGMHQPAFSPDGAWLAVNGAKPDHMNLFVLHPDGSGLKKITDFMEDQLPSWSPDNKGLVLSTTRDLPGRPKRIYVIDDVVSTGRAQKGRLLAAGTTAIQGEYATWMPDGWIVYQGCDYTVDPQKCGLYTIHSAGGVWTQLTTDGQDTAPAAFGDRIAFMSVRDGNWEVYVMNKDGSGRKRLTNDSTHDGLPTWSPDGRTIAFVSNKGGSWAVWAMSPDGSSRRKLFDLGDGGLAFEWENERISWGP